LKGGLQKQSIQLIESARHTSDGGIIHCRVEAIIGRLPRVEILRDIIAVER
jgi:hypothetical protein